MRHVFRGIWIFGIYSWKVGPIYKFQRFPHRVMEEVKGAYEPDVVVCQCGADGLSEDPMASFNLTLEGIKRCVQQLIDWNLPLLLLGGGK